MRGPQLVHVEPALPDLGFTMPCGCPGRSQHVLFWALPKRGWWLHNEYACGYICEKHGDTVVWEDMYTPWPEEQARRDRGAVPHTLDDLAAA